MSRPTVHRLALVSAVDPVLLDLTALSLSGQETLVLTATLHSGQRPDQDGLTGPGAWDASARGQRADPPQVTGPGAWDTSGQEAEWLGADQEVPGREGASWEEAGPRDSGGWDVPGWEEGPGYGVVRLTGGAWHEPVHLDLPMRHACLTCSLRDALAELACSRAQDDPGGATIVLLPPTVELPHLVPGLAHALEEEPGVALAGVAHVIDTQRAVADVLGHQSLSELGLALAEGDQRCTGEVHLVNLGYADVILALGAQEPGRATGARVRPVTAPVSEPKFGRATGARGGSRGTGEPDRAGCESVAGSECGSGRESEAGCGAGYEFVAETEAGRGSGRESGAEAGSGSGAEAGRESVAGCGSGAGLRSDPSQVRGGGRKGGGPGAGSAQVVRAEDPGAGSSAGAELVEHLRPHDTLLLPGLEHPLAQVLLSLRHDATAALARVHPATTQAWGGPQAHGAWTLDLSSSLPFHPGRLRELVADLAGQGVCARGCFWLPSRPGRVCVWELAGGALTVGDAGTWNDVPLREGQEPGEPRCHLVVTGLGNPGVRDRVRWAFERILLRQDELALAMSWIGADDGLGDWFGDR